MTKSSWTTIAPSVRACYRNGAVHIECFGVKEGINQCTIEPVQVDEDYLPEGIVGTNFVSRDQFFTTDQGVTVAVSYYSKEAKVDLDYRKSISVTGDEITFLNQYSVSKATTADKAKAKAISSKLKAQSSTAKHKFDMRSLDLLPPQNLDIEQVLASSRGEQGPKSVAETAGLLMDLVEGNLSTEKLVELAQEDSSKDKPTLQ